MGFVQRVALSAFAIVVALVLASTAGAARPRPSIRIIRTAPLTVSGRHFVAHERVKVTASTGASAWVRAKSSGAFTVRLPGIAPDRCSGLSVRAVGLRGSVAVTKRLPLPACRSQRAAHAQ